MRIKKVRIRNFRSIIDSGEINLDDRITILLGKNEQGKTNFLRAIETFGKEYKYEDDDLSYLISQQIDSDIPIITIWFELNDEERKTTLSFIDEVLGRQNILAITKYFDGQYRIEKPDPRKLRLKIEGIKSSIAKALKDNKDIIKKSFDFLNRTDRNKHITWLKSLQQPDGGFGHVPGQQSHITHTYFAVKALKE
ncbi:MAG: hypothetical protein DRN55_07820, partial [Thermoplasmata archaeon]